MLALGTARTLHIQLSALLFVSAPRILCARVCLWQSNKAPHKTLGPAQGKPFTQRYSHFSIPYTYCSANPYTRTLHTLCVMSHITDADKFRCTSRHPQGSPPVTSRSCKFVIGPTVSCNRTCSTAFSDSVRYEWFTKDTKTEQRRFYRAVCIKSGCCSCFLMF